MSKEKTIMNRSKITIALVFAVALSGFAGPTGASGGEFEIIPGSFKFFNENRDGSHTTQAGEHPFAVVSKFELKTAPDSRSPGALVPAGANMRNAEVATPPGLVGNPYAVPFCLPSMFFRLDTFSKCPDETQIGTAKVHLNFFGSPPTTVESAVYNLPPKAGEPATFGFWTVTVPLILRPRLRDDGTYGITVASKNIDETLPVLDAEIKLWGVPASPDHDLERGEKFWGGQCGSVGRPQPCNSFAPELAFLTSPVNCADAPYTSILDVESWKGETDSAESVFEGNSGPSGWTGCDKVPFTPSIQSQPSSNASESATGLSFELSIPESGITSPKGIAQSTLKKAVVKLPEGMTLNPSAGEGLGHCSPADFAREELRTNPGTGCPNSSKLGSIRIDTPLLNEPAEGSLFLAETDDPATKTPGAENPFDSLISMYMVARIPERGVIVKAAGKVEPDPKTGQIVTTFDNLPPLPFSKFTLNFREGARAPLATPPTCGTFSTIAELTPYSAMSDKDVVTVSSPFEIKIGGGGGPCPSGGKPSWRPGLFAGTINNRAGSYSAFNLRLTRNDGEQEFTNFSIKLPPGVIGKLAGVPFCPDAAVAVARQKTGTEELTNPSCPAASEVGRTLVGSGVGTSLTYVPGKVYLAGPYNGSQLSIIAITAAKVGPFDLGTVVIREAIKINPETAEVFVDPTGSDPIPHIIDGVVVHARDIRVYVDRPSFVLNPTDCESTSTASTVLGTGADFGSTADDEPFTVTSPFQAADCASLGFKPKLGIQLLGGTKRGDNPKLRATLHARPGDANIGRAQVTLPHSEFLDNEHIKTICTRVQFAAGEVPGDKCPAASVYGYARAFTPLLDQPIEGPVFLRSSSHPLPDLVAALHSDRININLAGRIDSFGEGRIRTTFEGVPDAPVTKFVLTMLGGKKGLLINSTNICKGKHNAIVAFNGQNGKRYVKNPAIKPQCRKK